MIIKLRCRNNRVFVAEARRAGKIVATHRAGQGTLPREGVGLPKTRQTASKKSIKCVECLKLDRLLRSRSMSL